MRIIVTGGAGFIGSSLCRRLAGNPNHVVLNIDKLTYAASLSSLAGIDALPNYRLLQADICDQSSMIAAVSSFKPDCIAHLAAESHVDRSITSSADFIATNISGTHTLLEATRAYWETLTAANRDNFRFLHVSTDEVFGSLGAEGLFSEATPYDPRSPYSASKAASDHLVRAWYHTYGLPTIISNCSNNYGPFQFPEKLIPLMILNAMEGLRLPVYGAGVNVRDWLHVDDHTAALETLLLEGRAGETYCVGGRNERTNLQVVLTICDHLDQRLGKLDTQPRRTLVEFVQDRPGHDQRYGVDCSKIEADLGWRPQETFETGLARTIDWYLAHRDWWQPIRESRYRGQRLGL